MATGEMDSLGEETEIGEESVGRQATDDEGFAPPRRGDLIDRYLVLDRIGAGALGLVFSAYDPDLDRRIAIKVLRQGGQQDQARMLREAQAIAKVTDPNVVTVHDVGLWKARVFLAMELVEGASLRSWLGAATRSTAAILDVFTQAGRGLAAAHAAGIVHRDFKPENVLVGSDGRVRVADFGIARASRDPSDSSSAVSALRSGSLDMMLTAPGSLLGTPAYMAPEQHMRLECTAAADQFSYCVALWEALYDARPFIGDTVTSLSIAVLDGKIQAPSDERNVPRRIRDALERGLATGPEDRHTSMAVLLEQLQPRPVVRRRLGWAVALVATSTAGGFAAARWSGPSAVAEACDAASSPAASLWNDETAAQISAAFDASGLVWSSAAARSIRDRIDTYASEWTTTWMGYCRDRLVSDATTSRELDARLACLDDRRRELGAVVEALAGADSSAVQAATQILGGLRDIERCTGDNALRARKPAPPSELLAEVGQLRDELERASAMVRAGARRDAMALVSSLQPRAAATGWPTIEYEVELASLAAVDGHAYDVELTKRQRRAFDRALALDDGASASQLACDLAWAKGYLGRDIEAGFEWVDTCDALWKQSGGDWLLRLGALNQRAVLESLKGEHDRAEAHFREALALAAERDDMGIRAPQLRENLAAYLGNRGLYDRAIVEYGIALAEQRALFGEVHPSIADISSAIGLIEARRGDFDESRRWFERASTPSVLRVRRPVASLTVAVGLAETEHAAGNMAAAAEQMGRALDLARHGDQGPGQRVLLAAARVQLLLLVTPPDRTLIEAELATLTSDPAVTSSKALEHHVSVPYAAYARTFGERPLLDEAATQLRDAATAGFEGWTQADRLQLFAESAMIGVLRDDRATAENAIVQALALDLSPVKEMFSEALVLVQLAGVQLELDRGSPRLTQLLELAESRVSRLRGDDGHLRRQLASLRTPRGRETAQ